MEIVILDAATLGDVDIGCIKKLGNLTLYRTTNEKELFNRVKDAKIVITNKVVFTRETLNKLPKLKLICIAATGINNVDLQAAQELGICVKNVTGYSTNSVVQHTIMLALNLLGQFNYYNNYVKSAGWTNSNIFCHFGKNIEMFNIENKQWGIIGLGTIGSNVGKIAQFLGAKVVYFSTSGKNSSNTFQKIDNLDEILKQSDLISIHAPLNDKTKNLITKRELELLKTNAILINTGRGGIVNDNDLVDVIRKKHFYFATDVLEKEPMIQNHPLLASDIQNKVIITPHIAWAYKESRDKLIKGIENNIKEFLEVNSL